MGVCGNVSRVAAAVKNSVFKPLGVLKYVVCLRSGRDGCWVLYRGAAGARAWEVSVSRHADAVCLCLAFILRQPPMPHPA